MAPKSVLPEDDPLIWNTLAMLHLVSGELLHAQDAIQKSLDCDTGQSSTWLLLGRILETDDDPVNAERAYRMSAELDHTNRQALYNLALLRFRRGDVLGALDDLYRVVELASSDQRAWDRITEFLHALTSGR